jgi:hypothetical protein
MIVLLAGPGPAQAQDFMSSLFGSAERTPSGIALGGSGAGAGLGPGTEATAEPEAGTIRLKFSGSDLSALGTPDAGTGDAPLGGPRRSAFFDLHGYDLAGEAPDERFDLGASILLLPSDRPRAASALSIETGQGALVVQGGFQGDADPETALSDRAFGGAAFESGLGPLDYALSWQGSFEGSTGALSLRHGNAAFGVSRDFGASLLSPEATLSARWRHDLPLGDIDLSLNGRPAQQEASTQINWSLQW